MKCAIVTFLVLASTVATLAVGQDGTGQGPPKKNSIIVIGPLPTTNTGPLVVPRLSPTG
jgi:hypothetical protein